VARVLILSSFVAVGHVGLSAAAPALQALGHGVTQMPTVLLPAHPGLARPAGGPVPVARLAAIRDALDAAGLLAGHDAVLTGYLPTRGHVAFAAALVRRMRHASPGCRVVVDPVLGDAPRGLYLPEAVARATREALLPLADIATPNAFELGWLAARTVADESQARAAARALGLPRVCVTSAPLPGGDTGVLEVEAGHARRFPVPCRAGVPHGTGDVLAALLAAGLDSGAALGRLQALIEASLGADHLAIAEAARDWVDAPPILGETLHGEG
jgi:pyridoxine kinase